MRIGVHTAATTVRDGDYFGRGVHEEARVAAQASANEILATEATLALDGDTFNVTSRRSVELKGVPAPVIVASWR
jgi:class 3 adenylate cyclase